MGAGGDRTRDDKTPGMLAVAEGNQLALYDPRQGEKGGCARRMTLCNRGQPLYATACGVSQGNAGGGAVALPNLRQANRSSPPRAPSGRPRLNADRCVYLFQNLNLCIRAIRLTDSLQVERRQAMAHRDQVRDYPPRALRRVPGSLLPRGVGLRDGVRVLEQGRARGGIRVPGRLALARDGASGRDGRGVLTSRVRVPAGADRASTSSRGTPSRVTCSRRGWRGSRRRRRRGTKSWDQSCLGVSPAATTARSDE